MNNILKKKLKIDTSALIEKHTANKVIKSRVLNDNLVECTCECPIGGEQFLQVFYKGRMAHFISDETIFKSVLCHQY